MLFGKVRGPNAIILSANTVEENAEGGTVIGVLDAVDPDINETFTFVVSGGDLDLFEIINDNELAVVEGADIDFEDSPVRTVTITVTNSRGLFFSQTFEIIVTDVDENHAPTDIVLSGDTIAEGSAAGTIVGLLSTIDPDAGDTFTYAITGGTGQSLFELTDGSNVVRVKSGAVINYEDGATRTLTVRTTDLAGATYSETLTINITNVDEGIGDLNPTLGFRFDEGVSLNGSGDMTVDPAFGTAITASQVAATRPNVLDNLGPVNNDILAFASASNHRLGFNETTFAADSHHIFVAAPDSFTQPRTLLGRAGSASSAISIASTGAQTEYAVALLVRVHNGSSVSVPLPDTAYINRTLQVIEVEYNGTTGYATAVCNGVKGTPTLVGTGGFIFSLIGRQGNLTTGTNSFSGAMSAALSFPRILSAEESAFVRAQLLLEGLVSNRIYVANAGSDSSATPWNQSTPFQTTARALQVRLHPGSQEVYGKGGEIEYISSLQTFGRAGLSENLKLVCNGGGWGTGKREYRGSENVVPELVSGTVYRSPRASAPRAYIYVLTGTGYKDFDRLTVTAGSQTAPGVGEWGYSGGYVYYNNGTALAQGDVQIPRVSFGEAIQAAHDYQTYRNILISFIDHTGAKQGGAHEILFEDLWVRGCMQDGFGYSGQAGQIARERRCRSYKCGDGPTVGSSNGDGSSGHGFITLIREDCQHEDNDKSGMLDLASVTVTTYNCLCKGSQASGVSNNPVADFGQHTHYGALLRVPSGALAPNAYRNAYADTTFPTPQLRNCTMVLEGDPDTDSVAVLCVATAGVASKVNVRNSIMDGFHHGIVVQGNGQYSENHNCFNCVDDDVSGTGSNGANSLHDTDPLFVDRNGFDYQLEPESPCVDAANANFVVQSTDIAGNPRLFGLGYDIGCYECQESATPPDPDVEVFIYLNGFEADPTRDTSNLISSFPDAVTGAWVPTTGGAPEFIERPAHLLNADHRVRFEGASGLKRAVGGNQWTSAGLFFEFGICGGDESERPGAGGYIYLRDNVSVEVVGTALRLTVGLQSGGSLVVTADNAVFEGEASHFVVSCLLDKTVNISRNRKELPKSTSDSGQAINTTEGSGDTYLGNNDAGTRCSYVDLLYFRARHSDNADLVFQDDWALQTRQGSFVPGPRNVADPDGLLGKIFKEAGGTLSLRHVNSNTVAINAANSFNIGTVGGLFTDGLNRTFANRTNFVTSFLPSPKLALYMGGVFNFNHQQPNLSARNGMVDSIAMCPFRNNGAGLYRMPPSVQLMTLMDVISVTGWIGPSKGALDPLITRPTVRTTVTNGYVSAIELINGGDAMQVGDYLRVLDGATNSKSICFLRVMAVDTSGTATSLAVYQSGEGATAAQGSQFQSHTAGTYECQGWSRPLGWSVFNDDQSPHDILFKRLMMFGGGDETLQLFRPSRRMIAQQCILMGAIDEGRVPFTRTITAFSAGSPIITVNNAAGLTLNMPISNGRFPARSSAVPYGTYVIGINGNQVTLSEDCQNASPTPASLNTITFNDIFHDEAHHNLGHINGPGTERSGLYNSMILGMSARSPLLSGADEIDHAAFGASWMRAQNNVLVNTGRAFDNRAICSLSTSRSTELGGWPCHMSFLGNVGIDPLLAAYLAKDTQDIPNATPPGVDTSTFWDGGANYMDGMDYLDTDNRIIKHELENNLTDVPYFTEETACLPMTGLQRIIDHVRATAGPVRVTQVLQDFVDSYFTAAEAGQAVITSADSPLFNPATHADTPQSYDQVAAASGALSFEETWLRTRGKKFNGSAGAESSNVNYEEATQLYAEMEDTFAKYGPARVYAAS